MIPLFHLVRLGLRKADGAPVASRDAQIFLRVNNGEKRSFPCTLHAIAKGQFHLRSKYYFNEGLNVIVSFGYVEISGVVLSSFRQETSTLLCVAPTNAELRAEPRFPINQAGRLIAPKDGGTVLLPCVLADISRTGMGVRVGCAVDAGQTAYLETEATLVIGEVRHCVESGRAGEFRAGLRITDIVAGARPRVSRLHNLTAFLSRMVAGHTSEEEMARGH